MGIAHWAPGSHHATGLVTLTRYTDPANNSDKYRRFIVLSAAGEAHLLITQTGRWTDKTARGDWSGGTYRFQRKGTAHWERQASPQEFLQKHVARKLGGYGIHDVARPMSSRDLQVVIDKTPDLKVAAGVAHGTVTANGPTPAATRPISGQPTKTPDGALTPPPSPSAPALQHVGWLMDMTRVESADQMELLSHYAQVQAKVKTELEQAQQASSDLSMTLTLIMQM